MAEINTIQAVPTQQGAYKRKRPLYTGDLFILQLTKGQEAWHRIQVLLCCVSKNCGGWKVVAGDFEFL